MDDIILELDNIYKDFSGTKVLNGISLAVKRGEFITLLGSSGCGKTTTLRIISGLESPNSGCVLLEGEDVTNVEPNKRSINTVFQNYALFPHMNVEENIGYSLKLRKTPKKTIKEEVLKMLDLVQLTGYGKRMPLELSGGQRQRVAIARSLIGNPKILLLDEPLGALDLQLRRQMQIELKKLQKKLGTTFIYITHDQEEALNMSDRIAVMVDGRFEQIGTPAEIYDSPISSYVASFVGEANIVCGDVERIEDETIYIRSKNSTACFNSRGNKFETGQLVTLAVRGENSILVPENECDTGFLGTVSEKNFSGGMLRIAVELENKSEFVCSRHSIDSDLTAGDRVRVLWETKNAAPVDL